MRLHLLHLLHLLIIAGAAGAPANNSASDAIDLNYTNDAKSDIEQIELTLLTRDISDAYSQFEPYINLYENTYFKKLDGIISLYTLKDILESQLKSKIQGNKKPVDSIDTTNATYFMTAIDRLVKVALTSDPTLDAKAKDAISRRKKGQELLTHLAKDTFIQTDANKKLINENADLTVRDTKGNTALHIAARRHAPALVKLLLEKGADINAINYEGDTPLDTIFLSIVGISRIEREYYMYTQNKLVYNDNINPFSFVRNTTSSGKAPIDYMIYKSNWGLNPDAVKYMLMKIHKKDNSYFIKYNFLVDHLIKECMKHSYYREKEGYDLIKYIMSLKYNPTSVSPADTIPLPVQSTQPPVPLAQSTQPPAQSAQSPVPLAQTAASPAQSAAPLTQSTRSRRRMRNRTRNRRQRR